MTPEQHEIIALKMRLLAQKTLLDWLTNVERVRYALLPDAEQSAALRAAQEKLDGQRREYSTIVLPGMHPAMSDLHTALFQEAFNDLSNEILETMAKGLSDAERIKFGAP